MTERELSQLQQEYRSFFLEKLRYYGVNSPAELTRERKSEFFSGIKHDWTKIKLKKNTPKISVATQSITDHDYHTAAFGKKNTASLKGDFKRAQSSDPFQHTREVIQSQPNPEQTMGLKIEYIPNCYFDQVKEYHYPVVKMPVSNSTLKLPRAGRSNQKGYKEQEFFNQLRVDLSEFEFTDNVHMVIPNFNRPYEPDIVLFDRKRNLYIDIEIDEPYDGYFRYPDPQPQI